MRAGDRLLDAHMRRRCRTRQFPVMREIEAWIFYAINDAWAFDAKPRSAERQARHVLKRHAVDALLVEIVHILSISLAVRDDVEPEIGLVFRRPADHVVSLGRTQRWLFHRIGDLHGARIAADNGVAITLRHFRPPCDRLREALR